MKPLLWIHADCLSPSAPPFRKYPGASAVFFFDRDQLEEDGWTLKRIVFLYECLLEMPVEILHGDTVECLREYRAIRIVTVESPDPRIRRQCTRLQQFTDVEVLPQDAFVDVPGPLDLKRFSRFWKSIESSALLHDNRK